MAHIELPDGMPGIQGPLSAYPETAKPLSELAELLLRRESPGFSKAERETVASYVSFLNECVFCSESHGAVADRHWKEPGVSRRAWKDPTDVPSERLGAYLAIAAKVQASARSVSKADVDRARKFGAMDRDIHDVVLITAAFCLYNRYVDGLGTSAPGRGDPAYLEMGRVLEEKGYVRAR